jgi:hypothetical protein
VGRTWDVKLTLVSLDRLIGFLLGTTLVGGYGYFQLLDDYTQASSLLLLSVEELKVSTEKVRHFSWSMLDRKES